MNAYSGTIDDSDGNTRTAASRKGSTFHTMASGCRNEINNGITTNDSSKATIKHCNEKKN